MYTAYRGVPLYLRFYQDFDDTLSTFHPLSPKLISLYVAFMSSDINITVFRFFFFISVFTWG